MLRYAIRALAACASIAAITLLAPPASAQFQVHPRQQGLGANADDIGPNPEAPNEPEFGAALAIRSELAFIGMPANGTVAVFRATPTTLMRTGTLSPRDPVRFGQFGRLLTYRDGILVVGDFEAAYVFQRNSNGVWTQRQKISAPAAGNVDRFANALRYEDGWLAIGASTSQGGAVYLYQRSAAGQFIPHGKLVSPDSPNGAFGNAIGTAGPVMVVGGGNGRVYVFRRNNTGVWRHQQTLIANELGTEGGAGAEFGAAVAIDRGMIVVGAPRVLGLSEDSIETDGAAYGFILSGAVYVEAFKLAPNKEGFTRTDTIRGDYTHFGRLIAMFGDRIVVGAMELISSESELNGGLAFSYTRAGSSVMPRGFARVGNRLDSLALADQRLLLGVPRNFGPGFAVLYRLNVFE